MILPGPTHAVVVESGVIAMPDGVELRRGTLVGPVGDGSPGMVAQTRTPVRLWVIPDASDLPPLVGATAPCPARRCRPSPAGAAAAPPACTRPASTRRWPCRPARRTAPRTPTWTAGFERRMWWLVLLLLLLALLLTAVNLPPGPAWAEMPTDRALLTVDTGPDHAADRRPSGRRSARATAATSTRAPAIEVAGRSTGAADLPGRRGGAALRRLRRPRSARCAPTAAGTGCRTARSPSTTAGCWPTPPAPAGRTEPLALTVRRAAGRRHQHRRGLVRGRPRRGHRLDRPGVRRRRRQHGHRRHLTCGDGVAVSRRPDAGADRGALPSDLPSVDPSLTPSGHRRRFRPPTPLSTRASRRPGDHHEPGGRHHDPADPRTRRPRRRGRRPGRRRHRRPRRPRRRRRRRRRPRRRRQPPNRRHRPSPRPRAPRQRRSTPPPPRRSTSRQRRPPRSSSRLRSWGPARIGGPDRPN